MTMTTHVRFLEPVDPEQLFGFCRKMIGIPDEQPFKVVDDFTYGNVKSISSEPGGFDAALWVDICTTGAPELKPEEAELYDEGRTDYDIDFFVEVSFDTTYGFRPCCGCLHVDYIRQVQERFPEKSVWYIGEFDDKWQSDPPPLMCPSHSRVRV